MSNDIHTYIEPELEARITALVLGEVSEFDVEELEQIIAEKPELQIFRRRMEVMHELIGGTVKPAKDEAWQLSNDRRAELRQAFASQAEPGKKLSHTVSRAQWRSVIGIAACVVVCLVIFSVMDPLESRRDQLTPQIISYQVASDDYEEESLYWKSNQVSSKASPSRSEIDKSEVGRMKLLQTELPKEVIQGSPQPSYRGDRLSKTAPRKSKPTVAPGSSLSKGPEADSRSVDEYRYKSKTSGAKKNRDAFASGMIAPSGEAVKKDAMVDGSLEGVRAMAKVIASNTVSPSAIPAAEMKAPDHAADFGDVDTDAFADGLEGNNSSHLSSSEKKLGRGLLKDREGIEEAELSIEGSISSLDQSSAFGGSEISKRRSGGDAVTRNSMDQVLSLPAPVEDIDADDQPRSSLLAGVEGNLEMKVSEKMALDSLLETPAVKAPVKGKKKMAMKFESRQRLAEVKKRELGYDRVNAKPVVPQAIAEPKTKQIPAPKRPQPLPEETSTSAQPFSTFSLNVSDVSFKLAKVALLEKGQWPDAAKVRTEEFVNAFDYGDPSPRRGEPVACAIEQSTHPFLQQRNLIRIGMKTAALGRSVPLRLTVLLDNSGSMEREDREASVLAAMRVLAAQLGPQDKITLVSFARQPRLLADRMSGDKAGQLVDVVANTPSEGGTNIEEALRLARTLAKRQHTEGAQDRIVLITDGVANLGNTVPEELSRQIETMRQEGIAFDACGVGAEGLNDDILEALTRKGDGRYYFLNRAEDADSGFAKQLAGALSPAAKNVKVQVVFNPKRVSKYRLLGFEKHRLHKEDFRNDKVDAAEMAAEEAGNAVYQIKAIPDGEGELGEVFVRFLDTNTGKMVERSWPLTYESQAKRFNEATPSMQLAGIASMLGEKLHGTDAGSVRFTTISNTLGKLRAHYAADRNVQDLIRMCEKVK